MMTKLITSLFLFATLSIQAATWTIHAFKDNATYAVAYDSTDSQTTGEMVYYYGIWSGDTLTISIDAELSVWHPECGCLNPGASLFYIRVSGPAPKYRNPQYAFMQTSSGGDLAPGEYWVDFAQNGSGRLSTSQPSDFGKWAWNGKINPSYSSALRHLNR